MHHLLEEALEKRKIGDLDRIQKWPGVIPNMFKIKNEWVGQNEVPIRVYYPRCYAKEMPCIFFVHGGGFFGQSIETEEGPIRCMANYANCIVVSIDYRLAPEHPYPAAQEDVLTISKYILEHGNELGIDVEQVSIMGESAGANLVLNALLTLRSHRTQFKNAALVCGIYQPQFNTASWLKYGSKPDYLITFASGQFCLDCYLTGTGYYKNSHIWPLLRRDLEYLPPLYIVGATLDPLVDDSTMLANKLVRVDKNSHIRYVQWHNKKHTGILEWGTDPLFTIKLKEMVDFLSS